jgi:DNA-directed RNA polymerase subunit RPC12/RpoP
MSNEVVEKDDDPLGTPMGSTYFLCNDCGYRALMFPRGKVQVEKKWWQFWK